MNKKKKGLILTVVALMGLVVITAGVTFAFFSYTKEGTTENTITTGTITFLYTEVSGVGRGISIDDAYPVGDEVGKVQTGEGKVFDFKVTSTTPTNASIPYEITARKKSTSDLDEEAVKLYLTKVTGDSEEELLLDNYNNLTQTSKVSKDKHIEKTLYTSKVPINSTNYEQNFRLRMWIDESIDFSSVKDEQGNDTYPYNDKSFAVTVNVYANAKVVTDEELKADINSVAIEGNEVVKVENEDYDYETSLPMGTTEATIDIETTNETATVEIERIDSLAYKESNIKRLSAKKTLELLPGDNYFRIRVINAKGKIEKEYTLKIVVKQGELLSDAIFNKYTTIYEKPTLTTSSNNTSDPSGLYKSTATNSGNPTYYFRGNVTNNYVDFAGFTWRVVRINEDGTIRLMMSNGINNNTEYKYNLSKAKAHMYYSNSNAKTQLQTWYKNNIIDKGYSGNIATGNYYCEQAKVSFNNTFGSESGANMKTYSDYSPNFKCATDANNYGIINSNIGLISYDEVVYAGGYVNNENNKYYLHNGTQYWTMSPMGYWISSGAEIWNISVNSKIAYNEANYITLQLRPVINLKADVTVKGAGSSASHWVVQ